MKGKLAAVLLLLSLLALALPSNAAAQSGERRGRNGFRLPLGRISLFDGPGIVNYEHKHRWMPGAGGAAAVIGTGAGAGAVTGSLVSKEKKKGALLGALVGGGAATGLWLYKNRTHKHKIF
jgi:hypothetical protein